MSRRLLDMYSLALLVVGIVCGGIACWLVAAHGMNLLIVVPSILAVITGARHIIKREAGR